MVFEVWALGQQLQHLLEHEGKCKFSSQTPSCPSEAQTLGAWPSDLCFNKPARTRLGITAVDYPTA